MSDDLSTTFSQLAQQWHDETGHHSSITIRKRHPAYAKIVALGWPVVPLLLNALTAAPDFWFPMLRDITGENPVAFSDRGYFNKMREQWLAWGREQKLL